MDRVSIPWIFEINVTTVEIYIFKAYFLIIKYELGASLVAQWLRICLPMQGTWVPALVWEDPTCRRATKPVCHNY